MQTTKRRNRLDLLEHQCPFDPSQHGIDDLMVALHDLFNAVGDDLGINDMSDDAFIDFACDKMSDAGVPDELIETLQSKMTHV